MTVHRITLPILHREDATWNMDLGDEHAQDIAIKKYLNGEAFPEPELIQVLVRAVRPGDFVIDCGACTGFFTLMMAALGAFVLAVEPGANNLPLLYRNIFQNNFAVDVRPLALGGKTETRAFLLIEDGGANSFTQPEDRPPGIVTQVDVRRLPDLVSRPPKLIKMDIEGAEFEVLSTWMEGPWSCPYIVVEYNLASLARAGHDGEELRRLMHKHGYELFVLFSDGMIPMWIPRNVALTTTRQNANVLFCRPDDLANLWPEAVI